MRKVPPRLLHSRELCNETRQCNQSSILLFSVAPCSSGGASSSFSSYSSSSSSSYASAPAASPALDTATLERKSLSELRAMARIRGVRGDTKAELVKLLS